MRLPKNGKVIILDNELSEATPLMQVLARNRIPYVYFTGDADFLPNEGEVFEDIRVLFLDINLTNNAVYAATIAQLGNTLRRIIKPGSPYIAAIWSNNQDDHRDLIEDLFTNTIPDIAPVSKVFLTKSDFFQYNLGGYVLDTSQPNVIKDLEKRIHDSLNHVDAIRLLMEWENSISEASTETLIGISKIVDNDSFWNDNLKHVYYKLAHAQLGKTITNYSDTELARSALSTLTSSFNDRVEMKIANLVVDPGIDISIGGKSYHRTINGRKVKLTWNNLTYFLFIDETQKSQNKLVSGLKANNTEAEKQITSSLKSVYGLISPRLNSELLISKSPKILFHPGNVYHKQVSGKRKRKLLKTYFPKIDEKNGSGEFTIKDLSKFRFIEVECTPICDFSQSKRLRYRLLPGVLFKSDNEAKLDENLDSIYKEIPPFEYKGDIYRLVFDYRLFKAINKEDVSKITANNFLFRVKSELLIDIQARISSHVNRPGIVVIS